MEPHSDSRTVGYNSKVFLQVTVPIIAPSESIKGMFLYKAVRVTSDVEVIICESRSVTFAIISSRVRGGPAPSTCERKYSLSVAQLITGEAMGIAGFFMFTFHKTRRTPSCLCLRKKREEKRKIQRKRMAEVPA